MCKRTRSVRVAQRERVFSFDGSTPIFFLARQKENGGGKPSIFIDIPGRSTGPTAVGCGHPALRKQHRWCLAAGRCRHRPLRPAGGRGTARRVVVPYGWLRRAAAIARASGAQRSVCAADGRKWAGIGAEIIPKGVINLGQSLSQPAADSSLCTREPLGTGIRIAASLCSSQ